MTDVRLIVFFFLFNEIFTLVTTLLSKELDLLFKILNEHLLFWVLFFQPIQLNSKLIVDLYLAIIVELWHVELRHVKFHAHHFSILVLDNIIKGPDQIMATLYICGQIITNLHILV